MTSTEPTASPPQPAKQPQAPWWQRWLRLAQLAGKALVVLIFVAIGLVVVLPTLLSLSFGTRTVLSLVNKQIPGEVQANAVSLSWLGGQAVEGLLITDPDGKTVISVDRIEVPELSLLSLVRGVRDLGIIRLTNPDGSITQYPDGTNSLTRAFAEPAPPRPPPQSVERHETQTVVPGGWRAHLDVTGGHLTYQAPGQPPIEISDLSATINATDLQYLSIKFKTKVSQPGVQGSIEANVIAGRLLDPEGRLTLGDAKVDGEATLTDVPIALADRVLRLDNTLSTLLGQTLNAKIIAKGTAQKFGVAAQANSQFLKVLFAMDGDKKSIVVNPESTIQLRVEPAGWAALSKSNTTRLAQPFNVNLTMKQTAAELRKGSFSLSGLMGLIELTIGDVTLDVAQAGVGRVALRNTRGTWGLDGHSGSTTLALQTIAQQGAQSGNLNLTITTKNLIDNRDRFSGDRLEAVVRGSLTQVPVPVIDRLVNAGGIAAALIGPVLDTHFDATLTPSSGGQAGVGGPFTLIVKSKGVNANLKGQLTPTHLLLGAESSITCAVEPAAAAMAFQRLNDPALALQLDKTSAVRVHLDQVILPLRTGPDQPIAASIRGNVDQVVLSGDPRLAGISLRDVNIALTAAPGQEAAASLTLDAQVLHRDQSSPLRLTARLPEIPKDQPVVADVDITIEKLPVGLIETTAQTPGRLTPWLGNLIDRAAVSLHLDAARTATITSRIQSERLATDLIGVYVPQQNTVTLKKDSWVQYTVTPRWLEDWTGGNTSDATAKASANYVVLNKPMPIKAVFEEAQVGLPAPPAPAKKGQPTAPPAGPFDPDRTRLKISVTSGNATLIWPNQSQTIHLKDFKASLVAEKPREAVEVALQLVIDQPSHDGSVASTGSVTSRTRISNLFDAAGRPQVETAAIQSGSHVKDLPTDLIDAVLGTQGQMKDLLGPALSVALQSQSQQDQSKQINLAVNSANSQVRAAANVASNVTLISDATANLVVSPELSQKYLKRVFPLFNEAVASQRPINLVVKQKGFQVPIKPYTPQGPKADADLNLGTIQFRQDGLVNLIRKTFQQDTAKPPVATFSPMKIHMENGVISYQDLTMTMDALSLSFRGQIDQVNNQVDMLMGVSSQTMGKAFNLGDVIEPGYEFQVPMRGTIDKPELDLGAVAGEVARLAAKSQLQKHLGGIEGGEAAGKILDLLGGKKPAPKAP